MDPGKLQDADQPMDQAAQELDQNDPGDALPHQEEVLKNLREGQKQMQQQMQKQRGQPGQEPGEPGGEPGQGQGDGDGQGEGEGQSDLDTDSLGRTLSNPVDLEWEKNQALSQKRREEISRMLERKDLPKSTRDYYERLLKGRSQGAPAPASKPAP
jgi:hypothetical protein